METLKIVTWNVNSARARIQRITSFLAAHRPDVVCLQEIKATEQTFPFGALRSVGYKASIFGQRAYNGVALLAQASASDIDVGLDEEARVIAGSLFGVRFINVYVPNGQHIGSTKHQYKLRFFDALGDFLGEQQARHGAFVVVGDFNVAPAAVDIAHPEAWEGTVLSDPLARGKLQDLVDRFHLVDVMRKHAPGPGVYTWWDYRSRAFNWNDGVRIDHILATPPLASQTVHAWVDVEERGRERPSDHAPVLARMLTSPVNAHPAM